MNREKEGRKKSKWGKVTEGGQTRWGKKEGKNKTILECDKYYKKKEKWRIKIVGSITCACSFAVLNGCVSGVLERLY